MIQTSTETRQHYDCSECDASFYDVEVDIEVHPDGHVEEFFNCPACRVTSWKEVTS